MTYKITGKCISCDLCLPVCPRSAISIIDGQRTIDPNLCNGCVDTVYTVPQCVAGCPTCDGCVKQPANYWEGWFDTYKKSVAKLTNKNSNYWEIWFASYSQKFSKQLEKQRSSQTV
jgi:ferredoxin